MQTVGNRPSFSRAITPRGQALNVNFLQELTFNLRHRNDSWSPIRAFQQNRQQSTKPGRSCRTDKRPVSPEAADCDGRCGNISAARSHQKRC
jgi:hypothetical protein